MVLPRTESGTQEALWRRPLLFCLLLCPICRQVVDNGITGLFCKVKDGSDLAKKMEVMIKMPKNERQKMGQMGRQKMLDQYDELIVLEHYTQTIADLFNFRNP